MDKSDIYDRLGFLTTRELWEIMAKLGIPYCNVVDDEKENLETGEKVTIPRFIPRTDYDNMKSDIVVELGRLNRDGRRPIMKIVNKLYEKRKNKINQGDENG